MADLAITPGESRAVEKGDGEGPALLSGGEGAPEGESFGGGLDVLLRSGMTEAEVEIVVSLNSSSTKVYGEPGQ